MPFRPRRPLLPAAAPGGAAEPSPSPPPALRSRPRAPAPRGDEPAERVLTPVLPPQAALAAPGPVEAGMLEKFELEEEGECPALPRAPPLRPGPAAGSPRPGGRAPGPAARPPASEARGQRSVRSGSRCLRRGRRGSEDGRSFCPQQPEPAWEPGVMQSSVLVAPRPRWVSPSYAQGPPRRERKLPPHLCVREDRRRACRLVNGKVRWEP